MLIELYGNTVERAKCFIRNSAGLEKPEVRAPTKSATTSRRQRLNPGQQSSCTTSGHIDPIQRPLHGFTPTRIRRGTLVLAPRRRPTLILLPIGP